VAALHARYPGHRILFTHMTPTGRQTGQTLFDDRVDRVYLPYDTPWAVSRFLAHFKPSFGLIMETELWPNLVAACKARAIPLLLVNARLSERSARGYARFPALVREALRGLAGVSAIGADDARRLTDLGARDVVVTGSVKFDATPPAAQLALGQEFRARIGGRPTFLCASTRDGEEALILDAWKTVAPKHALLVLVPRHPQRFDEVAALAVAKGYSVQRRSDNTALDRETAVWVGDSMGELFAYYASSDVAFVGGSLLDFGSQNLIEPCATGTPALVGPSTYNFPDIAREALACGAARQASTARELAAQAAVLLGDDRTRMTMGEAGLSFTARHRGATERIMALIETRAGL
jgi:3-deoxy-D-manno-octulosonic-acid transferase